MFQALLRAPQGLKMERHQLSFYVDYSVILETDMQNICLQYNNWPPWRYLQETVRTWTMEGASAWRNQANPVDEAATELTLTPDEELTTPHGQAGKGDNRCTDTKAQRNFKGESGVAFLEVKGSSNIAGRDYHL